MVSRRFDQADQEWFASLTGDRNPIHLDPVRARRMLAGAPVVHGVHLLLWALNDVAERFGDARPSGLSVSFDRFLLVGETATVRLLRHDRRRAVLAIVKDGTTCCGIELTFGEAVAATTPFDSPKETFVSPSAAIVRSAVEIDGLTGRVHPARPIEEMAQSFPQVARWLGDETAAALGATTRLVGMICPGLHSIFKGLNVTLAKESTSDGGVIGFLAGPVRHGLVNVAIAGGGLLGNAITVVRMPPQEQPSMRDLSSLLPPDTFAGSSPIVAGGSRGLGELTAKLLATGGADVVITWSMGEADAVTVAEDIKSAGGSCKIVPYHVGEASRAFAELPIAPTHGYYFAAPTIAKPSSSMFDANRFHALNRFFVDGFWDFADGLRVRRGDVRLFYPSTVYVEHWPRGLTEYAMSKSAGEILCAEMNARFAPLTVLSARLPRLPTDQTASLHGTSLADPVATLLPLIRQVQCGNVVEPAT